VKELLLSGHNPRETFGVPYPLSADYFTEFMARRQYEYLLNALAGGTEGFDLEMPGMVWVEGMIFVNINSVMDNLGRVLPADPTALGAPAGLVKSEVKPRLSTRLMLPFRLWRLYRETVGTYRTIVPRYRKTLEAIYWRLRECDSSRLTEQDLAVIAHLFEPSTIRDATAFLNAYNLVTVVNIAVSKLVCDRAPEVLNLLVGERTSTAQLGDRMWELRQLAEQAGPAVVDRLRQGETQPDTYRAIPVAKPLVDAMQGFLRTYGHRAFRYASEFEATRLADQPEMMLLTIAALLEEDEPPAVRAEAARQVGSEALRAMAPPRAWVWQRLLRLGSALVERREENRDTLELQNATYGLAARLLSGHHFPGQPPDYLWLYTFEELVAFGESGGQRQVDCEVIEQRRTDLERHRQQPAPPELIWFNPETKQWRPVEKEETTELDFESTVRLQGIAASAGSGPVEGVAVVTDSAQEAAERVLGMTGPVVLVTHVTDPVWSSLFRRLTAVVTEMGGVVSHAATVARENGIPAVVGVSGATKRIVGGQQVRVDGAAGTVEVIAPDGHGSGEARS
jgi:phosphohistidine swiveling domain-containing protein